MVIYQPIRPKRDPVDTAQQEIRVQKYLRSFTALFIADIAKYPAAQPWKNPPPKRGPRAGGRRTGTLGRNWSTRIKYTKDSVTIENPTLYGIHVQGPPGGPPRRRQTPNMTARGWPNVRTVGQKTRDKLVPQLRKDLGR